MSKKMHRIISAFLTVTFLVSTFLTGTYAWQSISQQAKNEIMGESSGEDVYLLKQKKLPDGTLTEIPIKGASFYLFTSDGKQIGAKFTTDKEGKIKVKLPKGDYYFEEIDPSYGFTFDKENGKDKKRYPFTVTGEETEPIIVKVYNIPKSANLSVKKTVVNQDNSPLTEEQKQTLFEYTVTFSDNGTYSYRVDNGELKTVKSGGKIYLKHGQTAVFENIPVGVVYKVIESKKEDYIIQSNGHYGSITENGAIAEFINIKPIKYGSLVVTKEVTGNGADVNKEFTFTATINGQTFTFTLKHGESKEFPNLPIGTEYTVVEKDYSADGYVTAVNTYTGVITGDNKVILPFINNHTQSKEPGDLVVEKQVIGNNIDYKKEFTFKVTFEGKDAPPSPQYFKLKAGEKIVFKDIPAGVRYTVTEIDPAGYLPDTVVQSGVIVGDDIVLVTFKNRTVEEETAELIVTKELAGDYPQADLNKEFRFKITLNGKETEFTLRAGEIKRFPDLPIGTEYTVTEIDYSADGYVTAVNTYKGVIKDSHTIILPFVNTYSKEDKKPGDLIVEKQVIGDKLDPNKEFTFEVTFEGKGAPQSPQRFTLKAGQRKIFKNIPAGVKYTVKEIDPAGYLPDTVVQSGTIVGDDVVIALFKNRVPDDNKGKLVATKELAGKYPQVDLNKEFKFTINLNGEVKEFTLKPGQSKEFPDLPIGTEYTVTEIDYSADGYVTSVNTYKGVIKDNHTITLPFVNTYTENKKPGDLVVEKQVIGDNIDPNKEFTFEVTFEGEGAPQSPQRFKLKAGEKKVFKDIPAGVKYTVKEIDPAGYLPETVVQSGTIVGNDVVIALFKNHVPKEETGQLIVSKELAGDYPQADLSKEFKFTITLDGEVIEFTLKPGEMKYFPNLPIGTEYTVTETDYSADGYVTAVNTYKGVIKDTHTIMLPFVNTYYSKEDKKPGDLIVEKQVIGENADPNKEFTFEITFEGEGAPPSPQRFTLKAGQKKVFKDIPAGVKYTVKEIDSAGYLPETVVQSGMIVGDDIIIVTFKNHVPKEDAKLIVTKQIAGNYPQADLNKDFHFKVIINGEVKEFTLKPGQSIEFDVSPGDVYEVIEDDYYKDGYVQSIVNGHGIIVVGINKVTVTNTSTKREDVTIDGEKHWDLAGYPNDIIPKSIIVRLKHGDLVVEEKVVTPDKNGKWHYTFKAPKYDLDGNEIKYTIEEIPVDGFIPTYQGNDIINTRVPPIEIDPPIIEKRIVGNNVPKTEFSFVMVGEDNAPMPEGSVNNKKIIKIKGSGQVEFGKIVFKKPGVFKYKIFEVNEENKGWTYDSALYMLTVTVTQENGKLVATYKITKNDKEVDKIIFTNSYKPDMNEQTQIEGEKTWNHGDNKLENRPKSIIVLVYANGKLVAQREVTEDDEWKYSFELPKYDENGNEIVYTIDEVKVEDYDKVVNGYDLLNTYNPYDTDKPDKPDKPDNPDNPDNKPNPDNPNNQDNSNNPDNPNSSNNPDISKTFDNVQLIGYVITMIVSMLGLGILRFIRKKK